MYNIIFKYSRENGKIFQNKLNRNDMIFWTSGLKSDIINLREDNTLVKLNRRPREVMSNKDKIIIYLDCDDTILYSSEAVIRILNKRYGTDKTIDDLKDWNYRSIVPQVTKQEILDIYESKEFWKEAKFNKEFLKIYKRLRKVFGWKIVSRGTKGNLIRKKKILKRKVGRLEFEDLEIIHSDQSNLPKSHINMAGGIQIDDNMDCLKNSSAAIRILFQDRSFLWNQPEPHEDNLYVVHNWKELGEMLDFFNAHREFLERVY